MYPLLFLLQMEGLVREMQDPENGVPVRSQKLFLTSIPSAFMGEYVYIHFSLFDFTGAAETRVINKSRTETFYEPRKMFTVIAITFNAVRNEFGKTFPKNINSCLTFMVTAGK